MTINYSLNSSRHIYLKKSKKIILQTNSQTSLLILKITFASDEDKGGD